MKIICIILARKGSVRIPNKNLLSFNKKPLILWTLKQALRIKLISKIILSTDSVKISAIAKKTSSRILINKRPSKLSGPKVKSESVIVYLSKIYRFKLNDVILILQPTSPLRSDKDIQNAIKVTKKYNLDTLHSGNIYKKKIKIKKKLFLFKDLKKPKEYNKENLSYNGAIYLFNFSYFKKKNSIYEKTPNIYKMKNKDALDIDNYNDIKKYDYKDYAIL